MGTRTMITVVIATYNRAHLLSRAIRSVLNQTHENLELIVVDDCSADGTREAVQSLTDARVRYVRHERNRGLPAGRNTGIHAASGEYVAFLDDDDEWRADKLEKQLAAIGDGEAILCAALVHNGEHTTIKRHRKPVVTAADLRPGNAFDPSGLLARTVVLQELLFDESLRAGEDWDAFIRLAGRRPIRYVSEPLLIYHVAHAGRMTDEAETMSSADAERRMAVLHKHRRFFGEFWFNFHVARILLAYWGRRPGKWSRLRHAVQRCGLLPVMQVVIDRGRRAF